MTKYKVKDPVNKRVTFADLQRTGISMLAPSGMPAEYNTYLDGQDVLSELTRQAEDERVARLSIMWDCPFDALRDDVERALDVMREQGAAFIVAAVEVKK